MTTDSSVVRFSEHIQPHASYPDFRIGLITVNGLVRGEEVLDLDGIKGGMDNGDTVGTYFPHPRDKDVLLQLAVDLASEHPEQSGMAMQLGAAIPIIHPFLDGNGRTSRAVHASLLGKSDEEIAALEIAKPHDDSDWSTSVMAREQVDLKPPWRLEGYIEHLVYKTARLNRKYYLTEVNFDDEQKAIYNEVIAGLDTETNEDLATFFKIDDKIFNGMHRDMESLKFGLSTLEATGATIHIARTQRLSTGELEYVVDMPRTLRELGNDGIHKLVNSIWGFRRLRAIMELQCLSTHEIGQRVIRIDGQALSVADHYRRMSKNLTAKS